MPSWARHLVSVSLPTLVSVALIAAPGTAAPAGAAVPAMPAYSIGTSVEGPGTGVVLPNGNFVLTWAVQAPHHLENAEVCVLPLGAKACSSTTKLATLNKADLEGSVQVYATGNDDVSVVVGTCCTAGLDGDLRFNSINGGKSFGPATRVGTANVDTGTFANTELVWGGGGQVQGIAPSATTPDPSYASVGSAVAQDSLTTYHQGVIYAEYDVDDGNVHVFYAPKGSNFDLASSYKQVTLVKNSQLGGVSDGALLTIDSSSDTPELQMFNGTSYGPPHAVPVPAESLDGQFLVHESSSGKVHVSFNNARNRYKNITEWTKNGGKTWRGLTVLGSLDQAQADEIVLNGEGNGVILATGNDGAKAWVQPLGSW